ncbi:QsdR family transcriptional regulator [Gordonia shandongensis]|uniref:QsdR family transcriptional regulator n=1 Tax=Gordonia shandongensis TaxID=376351 RepID=UPI0004174BF6|nr:QsdR family transcriptional regulator [Gordonia shandongensis]
MLDQDVIVAAAREAFVDRGRIEVGELAAGLGVNRSTLYRRFRGRDGLLAEVIWSMADLALDTAYRRSTGVGAAKIVDTLGEFAAIANRDVNFRGFLTREPERALKLMTTWDGGVQPRIVGRVAEVVVEQTDAGHLRPSLPVDDLALILVRITETFVYANLITGEEPDAAKVRQACAAMLGAAPASATMGRAS